MEVPYFVVPKTAPQASFWGRGREAHGGSSPMLWYREANLTRHNVAEGNTLK
jgi:hypothetical protein